MNHRIRYQKKKKQKKRKKEKKYTMAGTINHKYERVTLCAKENI